MALQGNSAAEGHESLDGSDGRTKLTRDIERDSAKDQAVVYIFILATVGLLGWALMRQYMGDWMEVCLIYSRLSIVATAWAPPSPTKSTAEKMIC